VKNRNVNPGAVKATSDPEWKFINLRRYIAYLEHSIDRGTQFVVFESNGPALWSSVRSTVTDFLLNEWSNGSLQGKKPRDAFFVRCDRTTMTQNDLDNGRLVCLVGIALRKPAQFVNIRIKKKTRRTRALRSNTGAARRPSAKRK